MCFTRWFALILCTAAIGLYVGCNPSESGNGSDDHSHDDHSHDDHSHDDSSQDGHTDDGGHSHAAHVHGPNGGELVSVGEPPAFRCEIAKASGEDKLTVYVLETDSYDETQIKADQIVLVQSRGREPQNYELKAINAGDDGMASQFSLTDENLIMAYNSFGFDLQVKNGDKEYSAKVPKNPHP